VLVPHGDIQRRFHSLSPFLDERMRQGEPVISVDTKKKERG
jgi:hypothetical protein